MELDYVVSQLTGLWAKSLDQEIGPEQYDSHFFELGGYSLLAIHLVSRINSEFCIELSLDVVFKYPSINKLSAHIYELLQESFADEQREEIETGLL